MSNTVTFTFPDSTEATVFFQWWVNNGREKLEDDLAAIQESHPSFSGTHTIDHGSEAQQIRYVP